MLRLYGTLPSHFHQLAASQDRPGAVLLRCHMCSCTDLSRLTFRAYQVLNKPLDELVSLLGFEIPQGPLVDLAGVKADGAVLHWKPADDRRTTHKYEVQVNGSIGKLERPSV